MSPEIEKIIKREIKKLEKRKEYLSQKESYYYQFRKITKDEIEFELERLKRRLAFLYQFLKNKKITRYIKTVLVTSIESELAKIYIKIYPDGIIFSKKEDKKLIKKKEKLRELLQNVKKEVRNEDF